jgi:hypothetical protein
MEKGGLEKEEESQGLGSLASSSSSSFFVSFSFFSSFFCTGV